MLSYQPLQFGLSFLEKEPNRFECQRYHDKVDENNQTVSEETWEECTKSEICSQGIPKDKYRADENDPEYFDNWV